tara:strand:+ start:1820 stop:2056 length:237 start_codon:yes stop_codon:yes gene_type:complete
MTWKRCVVCGEKADALENNTPYCSDHWFKYFTNQKHCSECEGTGECEYQRPVVDWQNGGYLQGYMDTCEKCGGSGYVN